MNHFSPKQEQTMVTISTVLCVFSAFTSSFLVITYGIHEKKRKFPLTLVFWLSISCLVTTLFTIAGLFDMKALQANTSWCVTQGVFIQFFGSSVLWCWFVIALNLYMMIVRRKDVSHYATYFHILLWFGPAIMTIIPLSMNSFGFLDVWCWIKHDDHNVSEFLFFYGPLAIANVFGCVLWLQVIRKFYQQRKLARLVEETVGEQSSTYKLSKKSMMRHLIFVVNFSLLFWYMLAHRLYGAMNSNRVYWMVLLHSICLTAQGFIVFWMFGPTKENYILWKEWWNARRTYEDDSICLRRSSAREALIDDE